MEHVLDAVRRVHGPGGRVVFAARRHSVVGPRATAGRVWKSFASGRQCSVSGVAMLRVGALQGLQGIESPENLHRSASRRSCALGGGACGSRTDQGCLRRAVPSATLSSLGEEVSCRGVLQLPEPAAHAACGFRTTPDRGTGRVRWRSVCGCWRWRLDGQGPGRGGALFGLGSSAVAVVLNGGLN